MSRADIATGAGIFVFTAIFVSVALHLLLWAGATLRKRRLEARPRSPACAIWRPNSAKVARIHGQLEAAERQYGRLVDQCVGAVGLDPRAYGTHSLRRTKVALIYKRTGNLRACQLLLGHRKIESTVRYLGIEVDDALALSEQVEL